MKDNGEIAGISPQEKRISVLPTGVTSVVLLAITLVTGARSGAIDPDHILLLVSYCLLNGLYLIYFHVVHIPSSRFRPRDASIFAVIQGVGLGLISWILPLQMEALLSALMILAAITTAVITVRSPAYFIIISTTLLTAMYLGTREVTSLLALQLVGRAIIGMVLIEVIQQLKRLSDRNMRRLEVINEFNRQITSSLDTNQVLTLLNAMLENALEADTYYVGLTDGDALKLGLLYDDGEYFYDIRVPLDGSLAGWVIRSKQELFLPDMRNEADVPGVKNVIIGKNKTSLSWMGVPVLGSYVTGVMAIASYRPNAFDRSELELLNNMAQHAALALDNTYRHAQVEEQARLDSLTGAYNHGHFIKLLEEQAGNSRRQFQPLSLIMLDIDHFKQYNDTFGHMVGDEILTVLCDTIKRYIKKTDAVGRWGGEEFAISLPGADGQQAAQVASRIHETMATLALKSPAGEAIPAPTLSQGIAQFPDEATEIMKLIDLADRRLYIAKERGRNQIEPELEHWLGLRRQDSELPGRLP
jgi:diguanylate cyclase (GGDEF)-like protein